MMEPLSSSIPAIDTTLARVIQMVERARKIAHPAVYRTVWANVNQRGNGRPRTMRYLAPFY